MSSVGIVQISDLEGNIVNGTGVVDSEFSVLTEMLMRQLLKLDGIEADGEAKALRRTEVCSFFLLTATSVIRYLSANH